MPEVGQYRAVPTVDGAHECDSEIGGLLSASEGEETDDARPKRSSKTPALVVVVGALVLTTGWLAYLTDGSAALGLDRVPRGGDLSAVVSEASAPAPTMTLTPAPKTSSIIPCSSASPDARSNPLKRPEALNDGNVCRDDEEVFGGLCYRKCALFPGFDCSARRISAFQCCNGLVQDCSDPFAVMASILNFQREVPSFEPCTNFDVSSADTNSGTLSCPHAPGACLTDEEQSFGKCYEKCYILTGGKLPYRCGAGTCGSIDPATNILGCLTDADSALAYAVGGGAGDGDKATPADPHWPLLDETEKST